MTTFRSTLAVVLAAAAAIAPASACAAGWATPRTITSSGSVQLDLAMGADGTAALVYVDDGVRVSIRRPGHGWSTPRRISDGRFGVTGPAVTVDGHGDVVVGWVQNGTRTDHGGPIVGPLSIRAAVRHGSTWGSVRQVGTTGHFLAAGLDAAANARGDAILVWTGVQTISSTRRTEAVQSAYRAAGHNFGSTQSVSELERPRGVSGQVAAVDARGTAFVAWTNDKGPVVRIAARTRGTGGRWGSARDVGAAPASNPAITVTTDGTAVVAWHAAQVDSEGNGLQTGVLDAAARLPDGKLTAAQVVSTAKTRTYRLAAGPAGTSLLAFSADGTAATSTRPAGGTFSTPTTLPGIQPGDFAGGAAYLGDGTALYSWGQGDRVKVIAAPAGGAFSATPEFDAAGLYPRIAASGSRAVVVWNVAKGEQVSILAAGRT